MNAARKRILSICLLVALVGAAAWGQAWTLERQRDAFASGAVGAYARENVGSLTLARLANGIPVVVRKSDANRILGLKAVLLGHVSNTPLEKAGLESVTLTMLSKGSRKYSYAEVQRLMFERSAAIGASVAGFDQTSFDLNVLDTYFDEMFDVWADAFLHPSWNTEEFPRVMNNLRMARQQAENDPFSLAVKTINERFFAGHPYAANWEGAGASLDTIVLDDVERYWKDTFTAGRLLIVAVGSFDVPKLLGKLDATFGKMPAAPYTRPPVPGFAGRVKPDVILQNFPDSEGVAYVRGNFALPSPDHPDYPALAVAFTLLDDVLFEIVRTRNGACYSAWSRLHGFTAGYGSIVVYRTSVPGAVKRMIDESIGVLLSGRCLSGRVSASAEGKSGIGGSGEEAPAGVVVPKVQAGGSFVPIAEALPYYKRQFVTSFYEGQQTNLQVADEIASSVVYRGDYRSWLLFLDRVNAVTPEDVIRVARQYLRDNPVLWIVLGSQDLLDGVKRDDYVRFTGE